ncbi:unnamed protein product [Thlaspi arvense]|uniref:Right handed beta helix domain-containing protein n=1 Tax=Thlaspi arvense TaxID=13288 RepID=A0AAU9T2B1_THLAR|nr:unnamed protein product [Thlaspi arvense]
MDKTKLLEFQEKIHERLAITPTLPPISSPSSHSSKMVGRVIYPINYGADPTGGQDSSDAILEALTDAFQLQTGLQMLPRVADLGGLIIDLQGGSYKIGKPLRFPSSGGGNLVVKGGTFRASEVFPGDRHLVELVPSNSVKQTEISPEDSFSDQKDQDSGIVYEDVTFQGVLFDSSFRGGGILVIDSARIRITNCYFLHFTTQGIKVQGGHETYISNSFLGQHSTVGGDKQEREFSGTGIDISSNDNAITDVVIFSAGIGISLSGGANMVTGVHCYNKATWFGGIGILVKSHLTRIDNCYLDYTGIVIEDPVHVHVTNALFLGDANIVLRSVHGKISGVNIVNNMFSGTPKNNFPIVKLEGEFHEIDQVVIDQNNAEGMMLKSTTGKVKVSANGTRWVADFGPVLVFPNRINHYQHSFLAQSGEIPANAVTNVSNNVVVVETDRAVTGTVSVIKKTEIKKDKMRLRCLVCLLLFLLTMSMEFEETLSFRRRDMTKLSEYQDKIQERLMITPTLPPLSSPSSHYPKIVGKVIYPIGYGADPTGRQDSSDAILEALTDAFQLRTGLHMMPRVADLGGLVIDLQGGSYKIGKPLRFPSSGGGNLVVKGGTFRASNVFPGNRHLVELVPPNSGIFFEDVTFRDILFDSSFRGGGILAIDSARIRITDCYFLHFTTQGINVKGGHETYISNTFLGQHSTVGGDQQEKEFSGTGIDISSTDNAITDVVIFSARIGISLSGEANMVTGVHCYNKATWFGGIGILVKSRLTRIDNCYLDYTGIVIEDPVHVHVTNSLFIGDANIVLRSARGKVSGLNIVNNMFSSTSGKNFPIVKVKGKFHEVDQVVIDQNNASGMRLKSTTGKSKVSSANGTRWVADFNHALVFPNRINHYQHSFLAQSGQIPANAVTKVSNNVVVVETDRAVTGTVSVIVYQ